MCTFRSPFLEAREQFREVFSGGALVFGRRVAAVASSGGAAVGGLAARAPGAGRSRARTAGAIAPSGRFGRVVCARRTRRAATGARPRGRARRYARRRPSARLRARRSRGSALPRSRAAATRGSASRLCTLLRGCISISQRFGLQNERLFLVILLNTTVLYFYIRIEYVYLSTYFIIL